MKQKKLNVKQKYDDCYNGRYYCITKRSSSILDQLYKYHCSVCNANLSCPHSSIYVQLHLKSAKHKSAENSLQSVCF